MKMHPSRVLRKLRAGEIVSCFKVNLDTPHVSNIAAMSGFDCLWIDREHLPQSWSILQAHVWAARNNDVDVMVRVPRGSYSDNIIPLEMDAAGIMVPHVMGLEDAKKVLQQTRFHPIGRRPLDGGNVDGSYTMIDYKDYLKQANEERFVVLQIEDPEPLDELETIASLEGIDMLFFGPADFSQGIGAPGDWNNPKLLEARQRIAEVAVKHNKFAATTVSIENMEEIIKMGYSFLAIGADVVGLGNYCKQLIDGFSKKVKK